LNAKVNPSRARELFDESARIAARGDYVSAFAPLLASLQEDQTQGEAWHLLARLQLHLGLHVDAVSAAQRAVQLVPASADGHYILGRALRASGRPEQAVEEYRASIELDRTRPQYFCSLGVACRELGRTEEAIASYRAALALDPEHREAANNLANTLRQAGRPQEAAAHEAARSALTRELDRLVDEGARLHHRGEYKQALLRWSEVLRLAPDSALAHHARAATLNELHLFDEALEYEKRALTLDPDHTGALDGACRLAKFAGEVDLAARYGERLQRVSPSAAARIRTRLTIPAVYDSLDEIAATRQRFDSALDELLTMPAGGIADPDQSVGHLSFYLAYHGECNRGLQEKLARLMLRSCPELDWVAPHCRGYRRHAGRLRVGFASELLRNHSIGKTSTGLIAELDRERFEVFVLNLPGSARTEDDTQRRIRQHADHWLMLEGGLGNVRQAVADLELDVLFYQDIGMTEFSNYLAYARLAPLQCLSYGHPDTTGIPNLDYFVSNDLYEPADAAQHYSERLFLLESLPTLAYYYRPAEPSASVQRASWGFSDADHLYVCAQTLFKLHPEFDELLAAILERDAHARIVLIDGQYGGWTERLKRRFARRMGALSARVSFINRLDSAAYLALLRTADVALDTIHFNGMNSSLEALAMGTPVVTWPKRLQRGRHTQAMYRQMELTDCIARDGADYVDIAVRLGTQPDSREALRRAILERNGVLYENHRVVREFERFFETALEESGNSPID
jgi:protein O-GlcNAc transferase